MKNQHNPFNICLHSREYTKTLGYFKLNNVEILNKHTGYLLDIFFHLMSNGSTLACIHK